MELTALAPHAWPRLPDRGYPKEPPSSGTAPAPSGGSQALLSAGGWAVGGERDVTPGSWKQNGKLGFVWGFATFVQCDGGNPSKISMVLPVYITLLSFLKRCLPPVPCFSLLLGQKWHHLPLSPRPVTGHVSSFRLHTCCPRFGITVLLGCPGRTAQTRRVHLLLV